MKIIAATLLPFSIAQADPVAIMGGQGNAPYASFIEQNGSVHTLEGLPPTGLTFRVGINNHKEGLIGGTNGVNAYAAFAAPDGKLTSIPGLMAPGEIYFVSINNSGLGLIGGGNFSHNIPYAAYVTQEGTATPVVGLPGSGLIYGVVLDDTGTGLIGGSGPSSSAYAAFTQPDGTLTPLTGLPSTGAIYWVASSHRGTRFIGGQDHTSAYASFVASNGTLTPIAGLPTGKVYSVGINSSNQAILGGTSLTLPYAALVSPQGAVTTLTLPTTPGIIYNATINRSGTGLIAGFSGTGAYGAFVSPTGTVRPLIDLPTGAGSFLDGIALHDSGAALVGGTTSSNVPFAALAAPNGTLTYLTDLPSQGQINSIAIANLDSLVPETIGPMDSWANTLFLLSNTLTQHNLFQRTCAPSFGLWVAPFGNYIRNHEVKKVPDFDNSIAGALLGLDYNVNENLLIGAGVAYAYNRVRFFHHLGHIDLQQESAFLYSSFDANYFRMNLAIWGGHYQAKHVRNTLELIQSKAHRHGWNFNPHLEISKGFVWCPPFETYLMIDYANLWQDRYQEQGPSGFNIHVKDHHASMVRTEVGFRFYETMHYSWGTLILEQKAGYANRAIPCNGKHDAAFIDAFSTFEVVTLSRRGQNHGVVQFHAEFLPISMRGGYVALDYQAEFGSSFRSNALTATLGMDF